MMEYLWATQGGKYHMYRNLNLMSGPVAICGHEADRLGAWAVEDHLRDGQYCRACNEVYRQQQIERALLMEENGK